MHLPPLANRNPAWLRSSNLPRVGALSLCAFLAASILAARARADFAGDLEPPPDRTNIYGGLDGEDADEACDEVDSFLQAVLDLMCDIVPSSVFECEPSCVKNEVTQEIFAGVTLGAPVGGDDWACRIGGRGQIMGEAALCMLREIGDLDGQVLPNRAEVDVLSGVEVRQKIGFLSFERDPDPDADPLDPDGLRMRGYHAVSICLPVVGCIEDRVQKFTATLKSTNPAAASLQCGDFPIGDAYAVELVADDSRHQIDFAFPTRNIPTPFGVSIAVNPRAGYLTAMKTVFSPYQEESSRRDRVSADSAAPFCTAPDPPFCPEPTNDGIGADLTDLYERERGACFTADNDPGRLMNGWSSQVGLGSRDPTRQALWDVEAGSVDPLLGDPIRFGRPDLHFGCGNDVAPARDGTEHIHPPDPGDPDADPDDPELRNHVGEGFANLEVSIDLLGILSAIPGADVLFEIIESLPLLSIEEFSVFVKPEVRAAFASQFNLLFSEAVYRSLRSGDIAGCDSDELKSVAQLRFPNAVSAHAAFDITVGLDLVITIDFGFFDKRIVNAHPHDTIGGLEAADTDLEIGPEARAESRADAAVGATPPDFTERPLYSDGGFKSFRGPTDGEAFVAKCLGSDPPPRVLAPPEPSYTEGDPEELVENTLYPCNICIPLEGVFELCVPEAAEGPFDPTRPVDPSLADCEFDDENVCQQVSDGSTEGCKVVPFNTRRLGASGTFTLVPAAGADWACDSPEKATCFDVCTYDPDAEVPLVIHTSAVELNPACGDAPPPPGTCSIDEDCADSDPCTLDTCALGPDVAGLCFYELDELNPACDGNPPPSGACSIDEDCVDSNPCTLDTCRFNPDVGGICFHEGFPLEGSSCDDDTFCSGGDICTAARCAGTVNPCFGAGLTCDENGGSCPSPFCGDNRADPPEECDGSDWDACPGRCVPPGLRGQCTCVGGPLPDTRGVVLVIDEDSIDNGNPPNFFRDYEVNDDISDIGQRAQLPFFANRVGQAITLHTGEVGDEGWFALTRIPDAWVNAGPTENGLRNFVGLPGLPSPHDVGRGLGAGNDPEKRLDKIRGVTPLRATGLHGLEGRTVCAVVFDSDISINYDPLDGSLKGDNLGTVAFEVLDVRRLEGFSSSSLPEVDIEILDAERVCAGELLLYTDAPEPDSSSEPLDIDPPADSEPRALLELSCGLGFELAFLLPPLMWLRGRRRSRTP